MQFVPPLGNNPMIMPPLGVPLPSQLSPTLGPNGKVTSNSNSPTLNPMSHSPPNMFIPPFAANSKPPPPTNFQIPSPNLRTNLLPNIQAFPRPTTSPSPPVSPLLNNINPLMPPFIPSPQMNNAMNPAMPPMQLNNQNPMMNNPLNPMGSMLPNLKNLNLNASPTKPQMGGAVPPAVNGNDGGNPTLNNSRNSIKVNAASSTQPASNPTLSSSRKSEAMHPNASTMSAAEH